MKTEAEKFMYILRTNISPTCQSLLSRTALIRIIKYFPSKSNQYQRALVCYSKYGNYIKGFNMNLGLNKNELRDLLPKRIFLLEDEFYLKKKTEFEYYLNN